MYILQNSSFSNAIMFRRCVEPFRFLRTALVIKSRAISKQRECVFKIPCRFKSSQVIRFQHHRKIFSLLGDQTKLNKKSSIVSLATLFRCWSRTCTDLELLLHSACRYTATQRHTDIRWRWSSLKPHKAPQYWRLVKFLTIHHWRLDPAYKRVSDKESVFMPLRRHGVREFAYLSNEFQPSQSIHEVKNNSAVLIAVLLSIIIKPRFYQTEENITPTPGRFLLGPDSI